MENAKDTCKILVLGLGASGGILASHLAAGGNVVHGYDSWQEHRDTIRRNGLEVEGIVSKKVKLPVVTGSVPDLKDEGYDYVFIAGKTTRLQWAVDAISDLPAPFTIVVFQNGIDNEDFVARHYSRERVLRVAINFGGVLVRPGCARMTFFHKPNYVGCLCKGECDDAARLASILTRSELETEATDSIKALTWRKNILNASMSPVSAVLGMTMAEVMRCADSARLVEQLLRESIAVAQAAGYHFGDSFLDYCLEYLSNASDHKPSMLADLERQVQTEIDYISSPISRHGHRLGIPVPTTDAVIALIKAKEHLCRQHRSPDG